MNLPLNITENTNEAAASALYNSMGKEIPFSSCKVLADYVGTLETEMPMGCPEKVWKKTLIKKAKNHAYSVGIVPAGLWLWFARQLIWTAICKMVQYWISKKGWV